LAAAGTLAGSGAFLWVLTGKTPIPIPEPYRQAALIVLGCFTAGCAVYLVLRISRIQDPGTDVPGQALPSSVRGPLPFTESDGELFRSLGRDYLIGQALAFVTNDQIPVILVSGESGVGKTSLLRAGLTGPLKGFGRIVIYWEAKPTNAWESLTDTVVDALGDASGVASIDDLFQKKPPAARPVIIIDQLEQLSPAIDAHARVYEVIVKAAQSPAPHPATWIISFRRDFVGIYEFLAAKGLALPFVLVMAFTCDQAEQVMATLADKAGVRFERQLLQDFTASAAVNGAVSSVDIGIGTLVLVNLAKRTKKDTITLDGYKFAGGSSGVLTAYVRDQLSVYPDVWQEEVLKALLALVDLSKNQRIAEGRSVSTLSLGSALPAGRLTVIFETLAAPHIRILEKLEASDKSEALFRLPHERFIQPIRTLSGSLLAKENLAQFVLDTGFNGWVRSRDPRMLLSGKELGQVRDLVAQRSGAFSADVLDYVRRSVQRDRLKIARRAALCVAGVLLFGAFALRVQWVPKVIADTRASKQGYGLISTFPQAGMVMTGNTGVDPKHLLRQFNVRLWRGNDAALLREIPGMLRASCQNPAEILVSAPNGNHVTVVDLKSLQSRDLNVSIAPEVYLNFTGSCRYFGYVENNTDEFDDSDTDPEPLHFWSANTGEIAASMGPWAAGSFAWAAPSTDPDQSRLIWQASTPQAKNVIALWNLGTGKQIAYLSHYKGNSLVALDPQSSLVAVKEDKENGRNAIELWDLRTGALLHEAEVDGPVSMLRFAAKSTLIFYLVGNKFGHLLKIDDLTRSPIASGDEPARQGGDLVWFQSDKDILVLGPFSTKSLRIRDMRLEEVTSFVADDAFTAAIVLKPDGSLQACPNEKPCQKIASGVGGISTLVGSETVSARTKQDNSLSIFDIVTGEPLAKEMKGDWATVWALARDPRCGDVFAWTSGTEVLRYRARWAFFGRPFANVHLGCRDQ
jgi:WD40 repeat protein